VIFEPNVDIKDELKRTSINITCYDRNGERGQRPKKQRKFTREVETQT
jgi:hypothetical protein